MALATSARLLVRLSCELGEGPVWDQERDALWFVDIKKHRLFRYNRVDGKTRSFMAPGPIGWILPTSDCHLLAGIGQALYRFDPESQTFEHLIDVPGEPSSNRLNDACTDAYGRVWFGSMDDGETHNSGNFYRFDRDRVAAAGPSNICITNGPAIDTRSQRIFFTDTLKKEIMVATLRDGHVSKWSRFTSYDFGDSYPDGPVVDSEGYLWTGLWNGWGVARFAPDGNLDRRIDLPVANATKVAFGGPGLGTGFVTTARKGLNLAEVAEQPLAGSLFWFQAPCPGLATQPAALA